MDTDLGEGKDALVWGYRLVGSRPSHPGRTRWTHRWTVGTTVLFRPRTTGGVEGEDGPRLRDDPREEGVDGPLIRRCVRPLLTSTRGTAQHFWINQNEITLHCESSKPSPEKFFF